MRAEREAGLTLIEALVAFAIAAAALAALVQGVLTGLRTTQAATRSEAALAHAQSRLAALDGAPLTARDQGGEDGNGFTWHMRVAPAAAGEGITLYAVTVSVGWTDAGVWREVRLETRRLGPSATPSPGATR
jgi:general secretion pathway protein I